MSRAISLSDEPERARTPLARMEQRLAEHLVSEQLVSGEEIREARARQSREGGRLTTCLVELGLVDEARLRKPCAELLKTPAALLDDVCGAERALLAKLDGALIAEFHVIPFARTNGAEDAILLATAEPWRLALFEDLERRGRCRFAPRFLDERPLALALEQLFEIPAEPRHHVQPRRRRSEAVAQAAAERATAERETAENEPELMSESTFEEFYQR